MRNVQHSTENVLESFDSLFRDAPSVEALEQALPIIRSTPLKEEILRAYETLAESSGESGCLLLLSEAFHQLGRFQEATRYLKEALQAAPDRKSFDALLKRFLPRYQERLRFYFCIRTFGLRDRDILEVGGRLPRDFIAPAEPTSWTSLDLKVEAENDESGYRLIRGDAVDMPLEDSSIDLVFSSSAFEHLNNLPGALTEMHRVLRPGGLVFSDFSPIWSSAQGHHVRGEGQAAIESSGLGQLPPWRHLTMTPQEMRDYLSNYLNPSELRKVEWCLYEKPGINRLFFEDYIHHFHASPLHVNQIEFKQGSLPDTETQELLELRQPGRTNFHVNGFRVILQKR